MKLKEKELENIFNELKQLANELGAKVRFERGDFVGGYCIVKTDKTIVINKISSLQKKIIILSTALKELGANEIYLPPKIRELMEEIGDQNENSSN
jgi:mRNA-degrading endonuclease RelE of RelBE toxin-antitoxin system